MIVEEIKPNEEIVTEVQDTFDYKGTLDRLAKDPLFRYRYLGDGKALDGGYDGITQDEYEAIVALDTDDEAMNAISELIEKRASELAGEYLANMLEDDEIGRAESEARRGLRNRLSKLSEIDGDYAFDFGENTDDYLSLDDTGFAGSRAGKLLSHLADKGFTIEQLSDLSDAELYALAARINGHENKMFRKTLTAGARLPRLGEHPVVITETTEAGLPNLDAIYADSVAWDRLTDEALRTRNNRLFGAIKQKERAAMAQ